MAGWLGRLQLRALVAVGAGLCWALCFGRQPLLVAPWLALVPLLLLIGRARSPARAGFVFGLAYWLAAIYWIEPTLETYGGLSPWLATLALLAAGGYLALYSAAFAALAARLRRRGAGWALVGLPAAWVALETVRGVGPLAFPWNLAGYSLAAVPGALGAAAAIGSWGLSFVVVAVNVGVAEAIQRRSWRPAAVAMALAAATLAAGAWSAAGRLDSRPPGDGAARPTAGRARLLQPNGEVTNEFDPERARAGYLRLLAQSAAACDAGPALLVWPESAAWPFSYQRHPQLARDVRALVDRGCPVLLNSTVYESGEAYNSVYLVTAGGLEQRYDKEILVPFGETVPFAGVLPGVRTIARNAGGYSPGRERPLLAWGDERLGVAICFEIVFPAKAARQARRGATALVTVTNDGWYGDSSAPWQHFRAARFRAAENRRPVLRAAITGVSGVIAADGSVESALGVGERGELTAVVDPAAGAGLTFFSRLPWLVPALAWGLLASAIFLPPRRRSGGAEDA